MDDLIINFTPTGMIPTRVLTPYVPLSVSEIVESVLMANEKGITIVHLHARDSEGKPTLNPDVYGQIITGIRKYAQELVICVSLSGRLQPDFEHRSVPLLLTGDAKPDMGSLTLSSLNFITGTSINQPDTIIRLAEKMREMRILPELEAFDSGMINYGKYLIRKKIIRLPCYMNLIVGNLASAQMDLMDISNLINRLPDQCTWSIGGIGETQLPANTVAISIGAGVRVGLEDNIYYSRGILASNEMLISRVHDLAKIHERKIMNPSKLRSILQLEKGKGKYGCIE